MLQIVARGLGELKNDVVFVGGAVVELYASRPVSTEIRTTKDIDCVVELSTRTAHAKLEEELRAKGFTNDRSMGAPICRWTYNGIMVDVMPTDSRILGFSNRWYPEGIENRIEKVLPDGQTVNVFSLEYFLAAKFEAHKSRGGRDLRQSHDFEDIIYIFDSCDNIAEMISEANATVKTYLKQECQHLLGNGNLTEGIESALPYGSDEESTETILNLMQNIASF